MKIRKRHALRRSHVDYCFFPDDEVSRDLDLSVTSLSSALVKTGEKIFVGLKRGYGLKIQLRLCLDLEKYSYETGRIIRVDVWFPSDTRCILIKSQLRKQLKRTINESYARYDSFVERGSGWTLKQVKQICLSVIKYKIFSGGCGDVALPSSLYFRRCCFAIKNLKEGECFLYAVAASLVGCQNKNRCRRSKLYDEIVSLLPSVGTELFVGPKGIRKFELSCPISVNVYGYERRTVFPYYLSEYPDREPMVNLLLYRNHYFCISNLSSLIASQLKVNRRKCFVCNSCLTCFASKSSFTNHKGLCKRDGSQFEVPVPSQALLSFQNYKNMIPAPFVTYCDMETMIMTEDQVNEGKIISKRRHVPVSIGAITVCRPRPEFGSPPFLYTGRDCIDVLLNFLLMEAERARGLVDNVYEHCHMTKADTVVHREAKRCKMCNVRFSWFAGKVRDHCHLSGKYRFPLCSTCNLTRAKLPFSLCVIFHGLSNYDSHFIIQRLSNFDCRDIHVIPRNSERYLSFMLGPLQFKDSYQFLAESLSTLVTNLSQKGSVRFRNVNRWVLNEEQREMMKRKGVFPYSYFSRWDILKENQLPSREKFTNDIDGSDCSIDDYNFAHRMWAINNCVTMKDYLEIYLKADVLLLADCFENFRDNCITGYEIDPSHYFSSPHFTFDAFLRHSRITLELFSDVNMYLFVMQGIRGGMSMVSKRYSKANNKYLPEFDPNLPSKFILYLDTVNLYGRAMQEYLPLKDFEWMDQDELIVEELMKLPFDGKVGCIVECTLLYPFILHEDHSDYPLAPVKTKINYHELSPLARSICDQHKLKSSLGAEKLLATFCRRESYVLHYRVLQLYVKHGMIVEKIHRGLRFTQEPFMKSYVDLNSKNRALSTNKFDIEFFKLLSNSLYGKTIENPEKRTQIKLCNSPHDFRRNVSKYNFKQSKIINRHLAGVELRYPFVKLNKPFSVGMSILDLSKFFMYDFHYNVMKAHFKNRLTLLYTDTDSLIYEIESSDVYDELAQIKKYFDFSNYPPDHFLYSNENKKVPGSIKDECASQPIAEFVGLRSKMYSIKVGKEEESRVETKVAKGVKKVVINRDLKFDNYVECLNQNIVLEHSFKNIRSLSHSVYTIHQRKVSLSPFEDKRFLVDMIHSVPYGHFTTLTENDSNTI